MDIDGTGHKNPAHRGYKRPRRPMEPSPALDLRLQQPPGYSSYSYGQSSGNPQLFDDTSDHSVYAGQVYSQPGPSYYGGGQPAAGAFSVPEHFLQDPVIADAAMRYGQTLVGQGKLIVDEKLEKYISIIKLKYYFAVDTAYVGKKLGLLLFPFTHSDWSVKYHNQNEPVQPRYEINAPDLYIPAMAYVTYILITGWILGIQNRFTPEVLGLQASSSLAWQVFEMVIILVTLYVMNIQTELKAWDLLAFCSYKYVGMIFALLVSVPFKRSGYYVALLYSSFSLAFFLIRTLKVQILPEASQDQYTAGNKRRLYLLLFIAGVQPLMMWWLTSHLVSFVTVPPQLYPAI